MKTKPKPGGLAGNHNQTQATSTKTKPKDNDGRFAGNHNETEVKSTTAQVTVKQPVINHNERQVVVRTKTDNEGDYPTLNHNTRQLRVKTGVKAGPVTVPDRD